MEYRREIDGLRAVAVVPVILFHAGVHAFSGGFVGVDVFFVISGFLITSLIASEIQTGRFTIVQFYERRARRILPALFLVMLVCLPLAWQWLLPNDMRRFSESLIAVSTFSSNILFYLSTGYFGSEVKPLLHTWSLAIEEQYYVLFPLILMAAWKFGRRSVIALLAVVAVASLATAQWYAFRNPTFDFLMLPTRFWELLVGALVALASPSEDTSSHGHLLRQLGASLGVALILIAIFAFDETTPFPSFYALVPTLGTALIIASGSARQTLVGKLLASKWLVGIGLISYSAYLWHQPMLAFARHRVAGEPSEALMLTLGFGALVPAYFSWRYIEAPFRDRKRFARKQIFLYAGAGSALFILVGLLGVVTEGFRSRMPPAVLAIDISRQHEQWLNAAGCNLHGEHLVLAECIRGEQSAQPKVALLGDSHAESLTYELAAAFNSHGASFASLVRAHCALNFHEQPAVSDEGRQCQAYQREILNLTSKFDTFIVFTRRDLPGEAPAAYMRAFEENTQSIEDLLAMGKQVILVYPIPVYTTRIAEYMEKNILFYGGKLPMLAVDSRQFEARTKFYYDGYDAIGPSPNLKRIYSNELLCHRVEKNNCVTAIDGMPLYWDESHLSNAGARLIVQEVMRDLDQLSHLR
jgi:peptidoglycan/LPS O-acetylase OafA/YrhL